MIIDISNREVYHNYMEMSWPYVAGFFDGEGCLHAVGAGGAGSGRYRVTISQTNPIGKATLEEIAAFLRERGVAAYVLSHHHSNRPDTGHWRPSWNLWVTEQRSIVRFVEGVFPYLRIKKSRAEDYRRLCILFPSKAGLTNHETQGKIRRDVFMRLMDSGMSVAEIARAYNMDYSSIWMKAKRMGYRVDSTKESNRKRAKVTFEQLLKDYEELGTYQAVARKYKVSSFNIRNRMIRNGVTPNAPSRKVKAA